jgi:LCP family protein required for cell wall assembly
VSDEPRDPTTGDGPAGATPAPVSDPTTPPEDHAQHLAATPATPADSPTADGGPGTAYIPAARPAQHRSHSGRHSLLIAGRIAVALVAVIVLTATGWEWAIKSRADSGIISRSVQAIVTDDNNLATATAAPPPAGSYQAENILLLGSDTRAGAANAAAGGTDESTSDGVANSDSQMIAHVSADRQHVTVLSIPRDTMIDAPTCKTWDAATGQLSDSNYPVNSGDKWHINSAYSVGGPQCSVRAIQDLTGLKIDRVIGIDFAGFQNMVEALGGVTVNVCGPIIDGELGTVIPDGGVQTIQGNTALNLVRARNVQGDTDSDLARIRRQQIVLSAILQQVTSAGTLLNPAKLDAFLQAFVSNTFTDNVTIDDLVTLAQSFGTLDPSRVTFFTLPTVPSVYDSEALDPDETKAPAVFSALLNDQPLPGEPAATSAAEQTPAPTNTASTAPPTGKTVDPGSIDLAIVNLTGRTGVATETMSQLNDIGFEVSEDNLLAPEGQIQSEITVEYDPSNVAQALTVASAVPNAALVPVAGLGTQVRLLLGSTYAGEVQPVKVGSTVTGTLAEGTTGALPSESSVAPLSSGELTSVNAGAELCA